jgi:hypothetical protein
MTQSKSFLSFFFFFFTRKPCNCFYPSPLTPPHTHTQEKKKHGGSLACQLFEKAVIAENIDLSRVIPISQVQLNLRNKDTHGKGHICLCFKGVLILGV